MIHQGGTDGQGSKLYYIMGKDFPAYDANIYDTILQFDLTNAWDIIKKLESEEQFTIVFYGANMVADPPWTWIISEYYKLNRPLRKNLKALHIVHPSSWIRLLFQSIGYILSPKFAKKLFWIDRLTDLQVKTTDIALGDEILDFDMKLGKKSDFKWFGKSLDEVMVDENTIPPFVAQCCNYIQENGLKVEGIFRIPGLKAKIDLAMFRVSLGYSIDWDNAGGIHICASVLKAFFRELPETLFPNNKLSTFMKYESESIAYLDSENLIEFIQREIIANLSPKLKTLFKSLFQMLHSVHEHSETNLMTSNNLAIVWTPNFLKGDLFFLTNSSGTDIFRKIVKTCIESNIFT